MHTIRELLLSAEKKAVTYGKENSAIKLLMQYATGKVGYELVANLDAPISDKQVLLFEDLVNKYLNDNIPIQHLMGYETFFGYEFKVNEHVLIPRFETEELVAKVLEIYEKYFNGKKVDVVDVGTGSGAIGITLALEEKNMNVTLTDVCDNALGVAKENAKKLGADINAFQSDILDRLVEKEKKFDILVSNPPYIPNNEKVDALIYDNEPHLALFGGEDGLYFYREILQNALLILKRPSIIAFEHADHHREAMAALIVEFLPDSRFETIKDMQSRDRITVILNEFY